MMRANSTDSTQQDDQTFFLNQGGGFASAMANDDTQLLYYQDDAQNIIEERYTYPNWTFQNPEDPNDSITGLLPGGGSNIVALTYTFGGSDYRSLFYIDGSGNVCTSNTTSKLEAPTIWSSVSRLSVVPAYTGSTAGLAACVDTNPQDWNGIMVFYGDTQNYIRALAFDFASPSKGWIEKSSLFGFTKADTASGLGCTLATIGGKPNVNVYLRSLDTRTVVGAAKPKSATPNTGLQFSEQLFYASQSSITNTFQSPTLISPSHHSRH